MARLLFQAWSFTVQWTGGGVGGGGRRQLPVGEERKGRWRSGLFHWPVPGLANFSNLQTVWVQAQGSEAKDPAHRGSQLADSSRCWTHITSGTYFFQGEKLQ